MLLFRPLYEWSRPFYISDHRHGLNFKTLQFSPSELAAVRVKPTTTSSGVSLKHKIGYWNKNSFLPKLQASWLSVLIWNFSSSGRELMFRKKLIAFLSDWDLNWTPKIKIVWKRRSVSVVRTSNWYLLSLKLLKGFADQARHEVQTMKTTRIRTKVLQR